MAGMFGAAEWSFGDTQRRIGRKPRTSLEPGRRRGGALFDNDSGFGLRKW